MWGMKILVVTHFYASHGGGIEIVADNLNRALVQAGHDVQWAASDVTAVPARSPGFTPLPMRATNFAEDRLGFPYPLWSPASLRRLASAVAAADVVHLHDSLYLGNVAAFLLAQAKRKPVLITQHIGEMPFPNRVLRVVARAANATLGRQLLTRAEQVVFIAHHVKAFFEQRLPFRSPPVLIMNGVDTKRFHPAGNEAERAVVRRQLGLVEGRPVFLFVGRFVERKGLHVLRRLAELLPEAEWLFAGWGALHPRAWNLPQVRVFEHCSPEELRKLYVAADLLLLPSVGEGFPLVVQEAMACGTPALVATETAAGCPSASLLLLHESVSGSDVQARWRRRIRALIADPAALSTLRSGVAQFALDHWSWSEAARAYEQCYRRLAF
jgi:glycosyltransferase involved in cell wall biosynthesis